MSPRSAALALLALAAAGCQNAPDGCRRIYPSTLSLREPVALFVTDGEPTSGPGRLVVRGERVTRSSLHGEHDPIPFAAPTDSAQALELCSWQLWGVLVESAEGLARVEAALQNQAPSATPRPETGVTSAARDGGFDVAFTAFSLPPGMGQSGKLARHRYRVEADGRVRQIEEHVYRRGPVLNWQTAFTFDDLQAEGAAVAHDDARRAERDRVVGAALDSGGRALPFGRR